jgi:hypothetical protein
MLSLQMASKTIKVLNTEERKDSYIVFALPPSPSGLIIVKVEKEGCDQIISKFQDGKHLRLRNVSIGVTTNSMEFIRVDSKAGVSGSICS